ncbi:hypothetical protein IKT64_02375 [Candidatus Saccharibacteria bacterium]|nr:hypothetical protein [Candidatus Saccharibacteria bacterium]
MNSAENLTIGMLNLSEESKKLYDRLQLPLDEVVLQVRRGSMIYCAKSCNHSLRHEFTSNPNKRVAMRQLSSEIYSELERLGMIRVFSPEQFQLSANVLALRQMVAEKSSRGRSWYYDSGEYIPRLIRKLDAKQYEEWQGYDDNTIEAVRELLKKNLSETEYGVICMRFGLVDGVCRNWEENAEKFGWKSKGGPAYHERNAICKLHRSIDELRVITKIS